MYNCSDSLTLDTSSLVIRSSCIFSDSLIPVFIISWFLGFLEYNSILGSEKEDLKILERYKNNLSHIRDKIDNQDINFYVDFIISFKDGRIGLFDTKSGRTAKDAGTRSDGLQKYLKSEIKKGKKLIGGILINVKGTWMFYDKPKYTYDPNDHSKWQILEI